MNEDGICREAPGCAGAGIYVSGQRGEGGVFEWLKKTLTKGSRRVSKLLTTADTNLAFDRAIDIETVVDFNIYI